jgi:processive 1,2-diacylglycerol beta-glucosyltransferase
VFNKVLILSASAGAGHIRAAQAVEKAFIRLNAARHIRNVDVLDYTNKIFRKIYSQVYIEMVNKAPEILGWLYDYFDKPWHYERRRLAFDKLNTRPFIKMLGEYQPDIAVCTHFLPSEIISWLKEKHKIDIPQAIVITDFDVHAMWLCRHFEHYFVALDETKEHLVQLGVPQAQVTVSGIPIDPVFAEMKDKKQMRLHYSLDPSLVTILISTGGFGVGPVEQLLQSLLKMRNKAQAVVICGKNEELKNHIDSLIENIPASAPLQISSVGYTTEMDSFMSAADLLLGKPGGLTACEALAKGLGFIIVNPIRGQEERNADHLLEEGVAIRCNNLPVLAYKMDKLLDDPSKLTSMQTNARRLGRPRAALEIVEKLLTL